MRSLFALSFVLAGCSLAILHSGGTVECERAREPVARFDKNRHACIELTAAGRDVGRKLNGACCATFVPSRAGSQSAAGQCDDEPTTIRAGFFGGASSRASLNQLSRRAPIQSAPPQMMRGQAKPFETIYREPTISPYLNLYRDEDDSESAPNYHAFVRPHQEQIETNRLQQREIHRLRGQLQGISTTIAAPQYGEASLPATGTRSRYMDTAQFYGGRR